MDDSTTPMTLGTDCLNPLLSLPSISSWLKYISLFIFFHFLCVSVVVFDVYTCGTSFAALLRRPRFYNTEMERETKLDRV